jgi:uncharacterized protein involved in exopolysaccharide biosynthesis
MDLNQTLEFIAQELPRLIESQKMVSAAQARADTRFSEFTAKIDAYIDLTNARLQRLERTDADFRAATDVWQRRMEIMDGNIADLIRALSSDHPNGSKQEE